MVLRRIGFLAACLLLTFAISSLAASDALVQAKPGEKAAATPEVPCVPPIIVKPTQPSGPKPLPKADAPQAVADCVQYPGLAPVGTGQGDGERKEVGAPAAACPDLKSQPVATSHKVGIEYKGFKVNVDSPAWWLAVAGLALGAAAFVALIVVAT